MKRINNARVYILETYGESYNNVIKQNTLSMIEPMLQKDYGEKNDCSITSIATALSNIFSDLSPLERYNATWSSVKKWEFCSTFGTFFFFVASIYKRVLRKLGDKNLTPHSQYFKGAGFTPETIIKSIDENQPIILNLFSDNRGYYKKHTVLIIGYTLFQNPEGDNKIMLQVYDNWNLSAAYVDYTKMSFLSQIILTN